MISFAVAKLSEIDLPYMNADCNGETRVFHFPANHFDKILEIILTIPCIKLIGL